MIENSLGTKADWVRRERPQAHYFCAYDDCDQREESRISQPGAPRTFPSWFYWEKRAKAHKMETGHPVYRIDDMKPI